MNMLSTIVPKSDQLNADDLIGGQSKTIKITSCSVANGDQPVTLHYEGDNGKPYKPCKSMRRVLVHVWGADGKEYAGRSLTLYRDDKVTFGGAQVGGLRISHMSHIDREVTMALTATRAKRAPYLVKPLLMQGQSHASLVKTLTEGYEQCSSQDEFESLEKKRADAWKAIGEAEKKSLKAASDAAKNRLAAPTETAAEDADLETAIAAFESAGGIFDEFAENNKISPKAIKASRGEARASWAKLIVGETELLKGAKS